MNTKLFALVTSAALYSATAFCNPLEDIAYIENQLSSLTTDFESNSDNLQQEVLENNIRLLETVVVKSIKRNEVRLAKYKKALAMIDSESSGNSSYDEFSGDSDYSRQNNSRLEKRIQKKIEVVSTKISALKQILFSIQVLKLKMA